MVGGVKACAIDMFGALKADDLCVFCMMASHEARQRHVITWRSDKGLSLYNCWWQDPEKSHQPCTAASSMTIRAWDFLAFTARSL